MIAIGPAQTGISIRLQACIILLCPCITKGVSSVTLHQYHSAHEPGKMLRICMLSVGWVQMSRRSCWAVGIKLPSNVCSPALSVHVLFGLGARTSHWSCLPHVAKVLAAVVASVFVWGRLPSRQSLHYRQIASKSSMYIWLVWLEGKSAFACALFCICISGSCSLSIYQAAGLLIRILRIAFNDTSTRTMSFWTQRQAAF